MGILKTKDAADLLSVSQTTIKRWASTFPNFFHKDRFGHYIFSEQEIDLLIHIKDRIDHGETLDRIELMTNKQPPEPLQDETPLHTHEPSLEDMLTRIEHVEHSLDQKADEVVSVQLLQQREELEEMRKMIEQLAASLETIQMTNSKTYPSLDEIHPAAFAKLQAPPRKRGLLRSFFSFL
ncbi:MerR family transcriptional regulator [Paenibacillus alkaliterrae]|uniref:MerR family transcriptional regulator n=1 Tax=Paenibacillus alkaliterrae TaxID=320909 RepID=UPI001F3C3D47|nr:MerR family transcriptional regulator [Paenibacillus alkaliterrae]MCF2941798.1 MerR family transcriptional regulator [Paenibacillus alkaliterrae]